MSRRDAIIKDIRELRYLQKKPEIPDAFRLTAIEVRTPVVHQQIELLVSNLCINPPHFHVPPATLGPEGQRKATLLEKAVKGIYEVWSRDAGKNLFRRFMDKAVETGEGIIKVLPRKDRWRNIPDKKEDEDDKDYNVRVQNFKKSAKFPITAQVIDRLTYYPWHDEDGLARVVEITERGVDSVADMFPDRKSDILELVGLPITEDTDTSGTKCTLIEYWDREEAIYVLQSGTPGSSLELTREGHVLKRFKHKYGRVPYFSGLGEETSSDDPNLESLPSAFPILYIAPFYDSLLTMWANVGYLTGFPTITKETPPEAVVALTREDSDADDDDGEAITPGHILEGPPGTKYNVLQFGPLATALTGMVGEMKGQIQGAQLPSIMQGIPPGSRTAGYAIQELASAAKAKYQNIVENAERAWADALNFALYLIEDHIRQAVYVPAELADQDSGTSYKGHIKLDPKDINGYYSVVVKIQPRNPVDRIQEAQHMANMVTAGLTSRRLAMEDGMGYEHPDEVMDEIYIEEELAQEDVRAFIRQQAIQRAGLSGMMNQVYAAQALVQMQMQAQQAYMQGGMNGQQPSNGLGMGQTPGEFSPPGGQMPQMDIPGIPDISGAQGAAKATPQLPRMYKRKPGAQAGNPQNQPVRGASIEGFRGR